MEEILGGDSSGGEDSEGDMFDLNLDKENVSGFDGEKKQDVTDTNRNGMKSCFKTTASEAPEIKVLRIGIRVCCIIK